MNVLLVMAAGWALAIGLAGCLAVEISRRLIVEEELAGWHGHPDAGMHGLIKEE